MSRRKSLQSTAEQKPLETREAEAPAPRPALLTPEHWQEIIALTRLEGDMDRATALIAQAEEVLNVYPALLEALDGTPNPAGKLAHLDPVAQRAERLLKGLRAPEGEALWFDFAVHGLDYNAARNNLADVIANFLCGVKEVIGEIEKNDYRQGPAEQVQRLIICDLCRIFDQYALTCTRTDAEIARARQRFVELCLDAANIIAGAWAREAIRATTLKTSVAELLRLTRG